MPPGALANVATSQSPPLGPTRPADIHGAPRSNCAWPNHFRNSGWLLGVVTVISHMGLACVIVWQKVFVAGASLSREIAQQERSKL